MEQIAGKAGGKTHLVAADLADVAHATDWLAPAEAALGPIDVLINNAGMQIVRPSAECDDADLAGTLQLDLWSPLALTRAVLPAMIRRGSGTVVNMASAAALTPLPGMCYYNAAKAGLGAYSESLRSELRRTGVNILVVYPGPVDTPLARAGVAGYSNDWRARILPEGTPDVLARRVRRAVEKRRGVVIYPRFYWLQRWFPNLSRFVTGHLTPPARSRLLAP
jgi:short-subunit dehydrogenase